MSASPMARQSMSQNIPTRNVTLGHVNELPSDYSSTPGGTIFSTTPGGTRIVYTGQFLKQLRNSPLARTPPASMTHVPGITKVPAGHSSPNKLAPPATVHAPPAGGDKPHDGDEPHGDEPQFEMDM